jgi:hypothetical protein
MMNRSVFTDASRPEHLADKYRLYALRFEDNALLLVHVGRPISFKTFIETYIFQHVELMDEKNKTAYAVARITGIEKIPNQNIPTFELTAAGQLVEIVK